MTFEYDLSYMQKGDPSPYDFDLEQQLALEALQREVRIGQCSPDLADQRMRKIFGAFFYQVVEVESGDPEKS
jgi:hypothetical protein